MPVALDLNTLSQPLREVFQSIVGERDAARQEGESQRRRFTLEIKLLKERIRLLLLSKYGPKAEQLSDAQLSLLELEPGVTREEVATEAALPASEKKLTPRVAAAHGRSPLPAHLPRVVELISVPQSQRHCATCGCVKCVIGHDLTEVLDIKPVELFVRVIKREKLACPRHPEDGVAMGPAPDRIIPGGKFSDAFIIAAVLKKYLDHLPLYRQSEAWWRDAQVDVSRSVLCDAIMAVGALLLPVNAAQRLELLARDYLQADETPVGVQSPDAPKGQNHRAWQWQYSVPDGPVVFDFQMSRSRAGPAAFLANYRGVVQTDAYSAYDSVMGPGMIHAGCWAHARRKFHETHRRDPTQPLDHHHPHRLADPQRLELRVTIKNGGPFPGRHSSANFVIGWRLIDEGQTDQDSSPCSTLPRSHGRTFAGSPLKHRLPRWLEVASSNRTRDRRRWRSI